MSVVGIAAMVAAITLVVLAVFMIRTFNEVKKTMIAAQNLLSQTETEFKPLLKDLHESVTNLKILTEGAAEKIEDVKSFMEAAGDTGRNLQVVNHAFGAVTGVVSKSSLWMTGAKVAGKFVLDRFIKKRR